MIVDVVVFLIWTACAGWIVFAGGVNWLAERELGVALFGGLFGYRRQPPPAGIKVVVVGTWLLSVLFFWCL